MISPNNRARKYKGIIEEVLRKNRRDGFHTNSFYVNELPIPFREKEELEFIEYADRLVDAGVLIRFPEKGSTTKKFKLEYFLGNNAPEQWKEGFISKNRKDTVQAVLGVDQE